MNQEPRTEVARRGRGARSPHRVPGTPRRSKATSVTVAWTPSSPDDGAPSLAPTELELCAALEASPMAPWTSRERLASTWLETIASARCSEVVLTARLGSDQHAKHRVLELVDLLRFELAATQPLIRVRFLPVEDERHRQRRPV